MQGILEQNTIAEALINRTEKVFGGKIGLFGSLFGCWHKQLSRPFTIGKQSYCSCLQCGARKQFNADSLQTVGAFHYPPPVAFDNNAVGN